MTLALGASGFPYLSQHFTFYYIPYPVVLRYIHTPELFMETHALAPPGARILHTQAPVRSGEYDAVHFTFTAMLLGTRYGTVFSSEAASSQLLLLDEDKKPYMLATLSVRALGQGCRLRVTGSRLRPATALVDRMRWPVEAKEVQSAIQGGYRKSVGKKEDEWLREYRSRVLKL